MILEVKTQKKKKYIYRMRCGQHHQLAGHLIPKLKHHFIFAHYLENNQSSNSPALQLVPNRFHHNAGFSIQEWLLSICVEAKTISLYPTSSNINSMQIKHHNKLNFPIIHKSNPIQIQCK